MNIYSIHLSTTCASSRLPLHLMSYLNTGMTQWACFIKNRGFTSQYLMRLKRVRRRLLNAFVFMLQLSTLFNVKEILRTKALHATMIMVPCLYAWSAHHGHQHTSHTPISFSSSYLFFFTISISISFTFSSSYPVSASLIRFDITCFLRVSFSLIL